MSNGDAHIAFCVDRRMLAALHVAAYSAVKHLSGDARLNVHVIGDDLDGDDQALLQTTLDRTDKRVDLNFHDVRELRDQLAGFPLLNESLATYFRLFLPQMIDAERLLYVDVDTLCEIDCRPLFGLDMTGCPIALAPEAPIEKCADATARSILQDCADHPYFNAGVMVVDVSQWRAQAVFERCAEFIASHQPAFHDQSALNCVLTGCIYELDEAYNCRTNDRKNWPVLSQNGESSQRMLHFIDYPKPWDYRGAFHPFGRKWWTAFRRTAYANAKLPVGGSVRLSRRMLGKCKQGAKERLLFTGYSWGLLKRIKGVPTSTGDS